MEHVDELIAAHALRALDPEDERAVEAHLRECERCRVELRQAEAVASALAHAAPAAVPPADLRSRVLASVEPVVGAAPARDAVRDQPVRRSLWPRLATFAAPALAVAVVALLAWNLSLRDQLSGRDVVAVGQIAKVGGVVRYGDGDVRLFAQLPPAPAGHTYEAWLIRGGKPLAAGTFVDGTGRFDLTRSSQPGDVVAVTLERGNGGTTPKGPALGKTALRAT
jgi:anti-sigma-K factor RskA